MNYEFTVIVPIYNEAGNLARLEKMLNAYFSKASLKTCAIFVDDGSTDGSTDLVREISARNEHIYSIIFSENSGKGAALKPVLMP